MKYMLLIYGNEEAFKVALRTADLSIEAIADQIADVIAGRGP